LASNKFAGTRTRGRKPVATAQEISSENLKILNSNRLSERNSLDYDNRNDGNENNSRNDDYDDDGYDNDDNISSHNGTGWSRSNDLDLYLISLFSTSCCVSCIKSILSMRVCYSRDVPHEKLNLKLKLDYNITDKCKIMHPF
jgi:hypothetical protein